MTQGDGARQADLVLLDAPPGGPLGVAVSGGSDSLGLLHILHDWAAAAGVALHVVTVDHGLRPEAAAEADFVAALARDMGHPHTTLHWRDHDGTGNLPDRARRARYGLMATWAQAQGIARIALGHTADDQAETLLMRLARGAGVDGLAAMAPRRVVDGVTFLRPLLPLRRAELRDLLRARGQRWIDDPTNDDPVYDRVRLRQAMPVLDSLGLNIGALCTAAANLSAARDALDHYAAAEARRLVRLAHGAVIIPLAPWADLPDETARRLVQAALAWVAGPGYPPRRRPMQQLIDGLRAGQGMALAGCLVQVARGDIRITRETAAVAGLSAEPGTAWDNRWLVTGPFQPGDRVAMTGAAGLAACTGWRETGIARHILLPAPAVWRDDHLVAAPLAGNAGGFAARLIRTEEDFHASFRAH